MEETSGRIRCYRVLLDDQLMNWDCLLPVEREAPGSLVSVLQHTVCCNYRNSNRKAKP